MEFLEVLVEEWNIWRQELEREVSFWVYWRCLVLMGE